MYQERLVENTHILLVVKMRYICLKGAQPDLLLSNLLMSIKQVKW